MSISRFRNLIPAKIEVFHQSPGTNCIAASIPGHSGCGHQFFLRKMLQNSIYKHGFCLRIVKCFADDLCIFQNLGKILLCDPFCDSLQSDIGVDLLQILCQCFCFKQSDLTRLILLAVKITQLHPVIIN